MKSSKVLYSTLAASALLAAGVATVAHADDAVPASSTPESAAVTPATSSSAPEATTPASETPASAQPTTPASSSATPASSASSSTSSASSTTASEPASSAETSASSSEAPKADEEITKTIAVGNMPVLKDGAKYHTTNGVILWEGKGDQLPPKTLEYTEESKKTSQYSNGDFSTVDEEGTVWTPVTDSTELSKGYGKYTRLENGQNKEGYINNGTRIFLYNFDTPADQGDLSVPNGTVDARVDVLSEDEFTIQYATPWLAEGKEIRVLYDLYNASNDAVIARKGSTFGLPIVTKNHPYLAFWIAPNVNIPDGTYYFGVRTFEGNEHDGIGKELPYTGKSNTFTIKNGKFVVPAKETSEKPTTPVKPETQPTTPSSEPTTPASQPTTPSSEPTTPASQPTTPVKPVAQPTTPSSEPTTPASQPTTPVKPATQPTTPSSQPTTPGQSGKQEQPASEEVDGDKGKDKEKNKDKGTQPSGNPSDSKESKEEQKGSAKPSAGKGTSDKGDGNGREVYPLANTTAKVAPANNAPKKASLPNTGEKASVFATVAGILVAGLAAFTFKRKEN